MKTTPLLLGLAASVFSPLLLGQSGEAVKPQPIPFSHKTHAEYLQRCVFCHQVQTSNGDISLPSAAKCMQCHQTIAVKSPAIQALAGYVREKKPIPWVQVYELPDYVYYSHDLHATKSKIACETCHGPVSERDVITREKPISMVACMDCHRSSGAPLKCNTCHSANP
jgi:Cytochrome c7 and related cytochrome c/Class III cytochrome C family